MIDIDWRIDEEDFSIVLGGTVHYLHFGANLSWQKAQIDAVRQGSFDESPWLGFYLDRERPYRIEEIILSSNLRTATITYTRWYQPVEMPERSAPIQQTAIYHRLEDRWLLSPPNEYNDSVGMYRYGGGLTERWLNKIRAMPPLTREGIAL